MSASVVVFCVRLRGMGRFFVAAAARGGALGGRRAAATACAHEERRAHTAAQPRQSATKSRALGEGAPAVFEVLERGTEPWGRASDRGSRAAFPGAIQAGAASAGAQSLPFPCPPLRPGPLRRPWGPRRRQGVTQRAEASNWAGQGAPGPAEADGRESAPKEGKRERELGEEEEGATLVLHLYSLSLLLSLLLSLRARVRLHVGRAGGAGLEPGQ